MASALMATKVWMSDMSNSCSEIEMKLWAIKKVVQLVTDAMNGAAEAFEDAAKELRTAAEE